MEQTVKRVLKYYANHSGSGLSLVFKTLFVVGKFCKKVASLPQQVYENWIAKFIAKRLIFLYWPIYKIFDLLGIRFVINIAPGVGHTSIEFDNFFQQLNNGELDSSKKYAVILKSSYYYRDFLALYRHRLWFACSNTLIYDLFLPLLMRCEPLVVDVGLARIKWHFPPKNYRGSLAKNRPYVFQYSPADGLYQVKNYYARRKNAPNYFPLLDMSVTPEALLSKLGIKNEKLCLVHIKTNVINATARITDPNTYLKTLSYLQDTGHSFAFIGREKMPEAFKKFSICNYSESKYASFKNDLLLFKACSLAILGGSGIGCLPDILNKPYLYLNYWHIFFCCFSGKSVSVPTLIGKKGEDLMSFSEQFKVYMELSEENEVFPEDQYYARNASEEEIFQAMLELERICSAPTPLTRRQEDFRKLDQGKGWLSVGLSRPSEYFLETHEDLF